MKHNKKLIRIITILTALAPSTFYAGTDKPPRPEFLFSVDQQRALHPTTPVDRSAQKNENLITNKWFNAPVTRLELLRHNLDRIFREDVAKSKIPQRIISGFEPNPEAMLPPYFINIKTQFDEEYGEILLEVKIEDLGKPRKPMTQTCNEIHNAIRDQVFYPDTSPHAIRQKYMSHFNTPQFKSYDEDISTLFQKNVTVSVMLHAEYYATSRDRKARDHFYVECFSAEGNQPSQVAYSYTLQKHKPK